MGMFKGHDRNLGDTYKTGRGDTMHLGSVNPKRSDIPSFPISHKLIGQKARVKMEDEREGKSPTHPQKTKEDIMHYIGIDISKDSFTYSIVNHSGKIVKQETVLFNGRELPDTTTPKLKPIAREREELARENARLQNQIRQELHSLFPEIQNVNLKSKRILTFLSHFPSAGKIWRRIFKTRGAKPCITIEEIISLADKSIGINDPVKEKLRILRSIPDINKTLAIYFICETEGKSRISKRGNPHLRRTLYLMSMSCILQNPTLKAYYLKKREHLAPKQAIIATASKLARIIYTLLQKKMLLPTFTSLINIVDSFFLIFYSLPLYSLFPSLSSKKCSLSPLYVFKIGVYFL